jgi:asparagine synthase (glutamine-hydrolysing)
VKVLLTGDGGDDVFLGYPRYRNFWIASKLARHLPQAGVRWWQRSKSRVPRVWPLRRAVALMEYATGGLDGVIEYTRSLQRSETERLFGDRLGVSTVANGAHWSSEAGQNVLDDVLEYELSTRFTGEYMTKVDGATMHHGIEGRAPFLDQHIWEFASALPFNVRFHHGSLKAVLRQLAREEIGPGVAGRSKRGFDIPVQRWIVRRWRPWAEELFRDSLLEEEGWLQRDWASRRLQAAADEGIAPAQLWYAIVLEAWLRRERRNVPSQALHGARIR